MTSYRLLTIVPLLYVIMALSCGGNATAPSTATSAQTSCDCTPTETSEQDYRHAAKHVDLPGGTPQEITVSDMLGWPQNTPPPSDAPRSGRELQLFHIAKAYLQNVYTNPGDCDIHFEISQTTDPNAPRVIVETPNDASYCSARTGLQSQLSAVGLILPVGGNTKTPLAVEVTGLAFEDYEHKRGGPLVATVWELHPAIVNILP